MSYNPVSTSSRSNSPSPYDGQYYSQQGYNQSSSTDGIAAAESSYLTHRADQLNQIPSRDPFQSEAHEPFTSSSTSHYLQHQHHPLAAEQTSGSSFSSGRYLPSPSAMRPHQGAASIAGSYDARDNNSHHSSARNLAINNDPNYNMTQSDLTLEGLTERWNAYQAWWEKQYKEQPFYKIWTRSKWLLLFSTLLLLAYSCAVLAVSVGYIIGKYEHSVVVMEFHSGIIYLALGGSILGVLTGLLGFVGVIKEDRMLLSFYSILLWPVFGLYVSVGYIAFRRAKNHLRAHLKDEWLHKYTREQRLVVQRNLKCCGYQSATWYGEYDLRCFPMINLPGCEHKYNIYEDKLLSICWTASFSLVPLQLFVMIVALLCSNHVDAMLRSGRPGLKSFKEK